MKRASILTLVMIVALAASAFAEEDKPKTYDVGEKVAGLTLTDLDGKKVPLPVGKSLTAVSIFATSCSACQAELELLSELKAQKKDLEVLAICVDKGGAESVKKFLDMRPTLKVLTYFVDPDFAVAQQLGFSYSPGLLLVQPDGTISFKKGGFSIARDRDKIAGEVLKK